MSSTPRLRMFAGPNGSGKSTIKSIIGEHLLGVFVNPDEIEAEIKSLRFLDFERFGIKANKINAIKYFQDSLFLQKQNLTSEVAKLVFDENKLYFTDIQINSYFASVAADFIRKNLLKKNSHFHLKP